MTISIKNLKKKINYRSNYRGTKEMDKLLSAFTKKYINKFNEIELQLLCDLLDIDDENLYKFNQKQLTTVKIKFNKVTELFKNYDYSNK
mgnify:CR=1 FL=1